MKKIMPEVKCPQDFSPLKPTAPGHYEYFTTTKRENGSVHVDVFKYGDGTLAAYCNTQIHDLDSMPGFWRGPLPGSAWELERSGA